LENLLLLKVDLYQQQQAGVQGQQRIIMQEELHVCAFVVTIKSVVFFICSG
jgi:hypothetical protein